MQTVGEFLSECGGRLAPFERMRVGWAGCFTALAAMAAAVVALAIGLKDTGGSWAAGFRFVILCALATVILLFIGFAAVETVVERSVRRRIEQYARESGNDRTTLFRAAELRGSQLAGGGRLVGLLKEMAR